MASGASKLSYSSLQDNTTEHLPGDPTYYVMEETSRGLKKNRHTSLSSMSLSAYSDNPNNLKSPSSVDRTFWSSASTKSSAALENGCHFDYNLPSLAPSTSRYIPAAKNNNSSPYSQRRGWNFSWQWSRMRKSITRENNGPSQKKASEANHSPSQAISSNDNLREEIDPMSLDDTRHTAFNIASFNRHRSHYRNREKTSHFEDEKQSSISLSNKYQPKSFQDIVGQEINIKVLYGAVQKKRISQLYLFHGPSGTGKTSAAVIFTMALLCESSLLNTPCWMCRGCSRSIFMMELCSGSRTAGFQKISTLVQCTSFAHAVPGYKVFIIDSHSLTAQAWDELLGILENTHNASLVFVLITADANVIPESVSSRCQKFCFPRLRSCAVKLKLERIIGEEGTQIEEEALKLIVSKAQGSLREAEHILDQLTVLGPRVTSSTVQQLLGLVPKNELISLLTSAISGDTKTTIMTARELVAGGVEAEAIVLHLASLITDILTGSDITTHPSDFAIPSKKQKSLANTPSQILCYALKVLLEAEKQPRSSIDQVTWVYSALLQIAALNCSDEISSENSFCNRKLLPLGDATIPHSISIASHSSEGAPCVQQSPQCRGLDTSNEGKEKTGRCKGNGDEKHFNLASLTNVGEIWLNILERIQNKDMKEFLSNHAKLASLTVSHANAIVHLMFNRTHDKMEAQISEESICNALEMAIGCPVVVNISSEPVDLGNIEKCRLAGCNQPKVQLPKSFLPELVDNANRNASLHQNRYNAAGLSSVKDSKALTVSRPIKQENRLGSYSGSTTNSLRKDQFPEDATRIIRREEPQHKWLSLSSFQNDANIEPYSQDILFENEKTANRRRATIHSKLKKDSAKVPEVHHLGINQQRKGVLRSWSCKELLSQKTKK